MSSSAAVPLSSTPAAYEVAPDSVAEAEAMADRHLARRRSGGCSGFDGELPVAAIEGGGDRLIGHFFLFQG